MVYISSAFYCLKWLVFYDYLIVNLFCMLCIKIISFGLLVYLEKDKLQQIAQCILEFKSHIRTGANHNIVLEEMTSVSLTVVEEMQQWGN